MSQQLSVSSMQSSRDKISFLITGCLVQAFCAGFVVAQPKAAVELEAEVQQLLSDLSRANRPEKCFEVAVKLCQVQRRRIVPQLAYFSVASGKDEYDLLLKVLQINLNGEVSAFLFLALPFTESADERYAHWACHVADDLITNDSFSAHTIKASALYVFEQRKTGGGKRIAQVLFRNEPDRSFSAFNQMWWDGDVKKVRATEGEHHIIAEYDWQQGQGSDGDVQAARAALGALSTNSEWWVRLYVAEQCLRHEEFRTPELLKRLRADPEPIVMQAVDRPRAP